MAQQQSTMDGNGRRTITIRELVALILMAIGIVGLPVGAYGVWGWGGVLMVLSLYAIGIGVGLGFIDTSSGKEE